MRDLLRNYRRPRVGAVIAIVLLVLCCSCHHSPRRKAGDVLLIVVDTLRADHLGIYGYERHTTPNLDQFFSKAAIFERSYSTAGYTPPSVASILSGTSPRTHRVRRYGRHVDGDLPILPEMLPKAYQTAGFVSSTPLTGESLGIGARFDHYDDKLEETLGNTAYQRVARSTTDAVLRWLGESRDSKRPLFLFVHYIDPHWPYRPPATWASRFSGEPPQPVFVEPLAPVGEDVAHGKANRYDGEVAYLDQEIGRLLQGYADTASIDDALVVLTADHGETMMDGAIWFAHVDVLQPVIHVPLLIRGPGVESGRRMNLVSGIDVVPTVLGFASVEKPDRLPGLDLRKHHPNGERTVFSEAIGLVSTRAAIQGLQKWTLVIDKEGELTNLQRFDLATDPHAVHPLDWRQPPAEAAQALLARTRDDLESETHSTVKIERTLSAAQRERLRQLGYVE